ncbi:MAG: asparaginase domain-containing protein [Bacteroidota bacterium]
MEIRIFATGGTFDKNYDYIHGELFFEETQLPEMFRLGRNSVKVNLRTLMMIDSLDMTAEDRDLIVRNCQNCPEDRILITHGTDTMVETAKILAEADIPKTIVLTGAMVPYRFGSSDGFFNLGSALAFAQLLDTGVYVVMNGRYFDWNNVRKNRETGFFEEKQK